MIWQFEDSQYGLKNIAEVKEDAEVYGFCEEVVALYRRVEAGDDPTEGEFHQLYERIDRAWARAWARAGAWAGAWAWARAGAWAWAWAWARAWVWARARAGAWARARAGAGVEDPYWTAAADQLIRLLEDATLTDSVGE